MIRTVLVLIFICIFYSLSFGQQGSGIGSGRGTKDGIIVASTKKTVKTNKGTQPLKILSKPPGKYTDSARQNNIQGEVHLRVTFLKSGGIGEIKIVKALPFGLTEQAIAAAKGIRFEPEYKKGKPQSVTKVVKYTFVLY